MPVGEWKELIVEDHPTRITVLPGETEPRGEADVTVDEETYRRMYSGYQCPWCYQLLEHAYDRTCREWCCGGSRVYTPAEWHAYMDGTLDGDKWIGPSRQTWERMNNPAEPKDATKTSIWVPNGKGD